MMSLNFTFKDPLFPAKEIVKRELLGHFLLLPKRERFLIDLNESAQLIWRHLTMRGSSTINEMIQILRNEFELSADYFIENDVKTMIQMLINKGIIVTKHQSILRELKSDGQLGEYDDLFNFSELFHEQAAKEFIPITGGIELTQQCNLRCTHCYLDSLVELKNKMEFSYITELLRQLTEAGCLWLLFTGGEPLIREDFLKIYDLAKSLGFIITIFTNGTLISPEIADYFQKFPPLLIEVTFHAADQSVFESITKIKGSYSKCIKGLSLLSERDIPFHIKMVVMKQNVNEVKKTEELVYQLGAKDFRLDTIINADFHHSGKMGQIRLNPEEVLQLDLVEPFYSRWLKAFKQSKQQQQEGKKPTNHLFPCRAGLCSFTISSTGELLPCVLVREPSWLIVDRTFFQRWQELNHFRLTEKMRDDNQCLNCEAINCSRCPAWGLLEKGDPNKKSEYICTIQKQRERIFS